MARFSDPRSRLVYSSDRGSICPDCGASAHQGRCKNAPKEAPQGSGRVRIRIEKSGRKGKTVTVVEGLALTGEKLKALAKKLKAHCGSGGSVKDGAIEIQGAHIDRVRSFLSSEGLMSR